MSDQPIVVPLSLRDSDFDGVSDYDELYVLGTNPYAADTDLNGIPDGSDLNPRIPAAIANFDDAQYFMSTLKRIGCRFALDNFGSGLSSFAYLMNLPVDYLKIDGSFVKNISNDPVSQAIVEAFNGIAHAMSLKTIAEFVEDEIILEKLRIIGVDYAQGYVIARPIPLEF